MRGGIRAALAAVVVVVVLVAGAVVFLLTHRPRIPECVVTGISGAVYSFTPQQTANAATIAAVDMKLGLPAHAATIAIATALQESKLRNLDGGDRDSIGLFQQRPSQGWGSPDQLQDPVYAATAFYASLVRLQDWATLPVTVAAQQVQHSGLPEAYAQWEDQARALAAALTGQLPAALTCRHLVLGAPDGSLVSAAQNQLGTAQLSGSHPVDQGWAMATWLVAHAVDFGVDRVGFDGRTWTANSGAWHSDSAAKALSLHQSAVTG